MLRVTAERPESERRASFSGEPLGHDDDERMIAAHFRECSEYSEARIVGVLDVVDFDDEGPALADLGEPLFERSRVLVSLDVTVRSELSVLFLASLHFATEHG